jgi:hypothetical protein
MAESPRTEPATLATSRLTLAPLPQRPRLRAWVPALVSLALDPGDANSQNASDETGADDEARDYLLEITGGDHDLSYVSVDELVGTVVGLAVDPWPGVDERGRLVFAGSAVVDSLEVDLGLLQTFVTEHRRWSAGLGLCPSELVDEPLRIGDVYGITVTIRKGRRGAARIRRVGPLPTLCVPNEHGTGVVELAGLYRGSTHCAMTDVGFDARELARVAYYAAMATELDPRRRADRAIVEATTGALLDRMGKARPGGG